MEVTLEPTIEGAVTDAFEGKHEGHGYHLARAQRGLRVFRLVLHLIVYTEE
jgi:hypothetical protein